MPGFKDKYIVGLCRVHVIGQILRLMYLDAKNIKAPSGTWTDI